MTLYALHGFLGKKEDWETVLPNCVAIDLFQSPIQSFHQWAENFNGKVKPGSILVGYSLGGRLALHALKNNPTLWKGAVLISPHLGFKTEEEKAERLKSDRKWAKRFLNDRWERVVEDWNSLPVFCTMPPVFHRKEEEFNRTHLSVALEKWSLGLQEDFTPLVRSLNFPILWVTGEKEKRTPPFFTHSHSRHFEVPNGGHRSPWEATKTFQHEIQKFIGEIV